MKGLTLWDVKKGKISNSSWRFPTWPQPSTGSLDSPTDLIAPHVGSNHLRTSHFLCDSRRKQVPWTTPSLEPCLSQLPEEYWKSKFFPIKTLLSQRSSISGLKSLTHQHWAHCWNHHEGGSVSWPIVDVNQSSKENLENSHWTLCQAAMFEYFFLLMRQPRNQKGSSNFCQKKRGKTFGPSDSDQKLQDSVTPGSSAALAALGNYFFIQRTGTWKFGVSEGFRFHPPVRPFCVCTSRFWEFPSLSIPRPSNGFVLLDHEKPSLELWKLRPLNSKRFNLQGDKFIRSWRSQMVDWLRGHLTYLLYLLFVILFH